MATNKIIQTVRCLVVHCIFNSDWNDDGVLPDTAAALCMLC